MEAHVLRIVSRGKTPATGRLEHLPKLWLHAPVRFELACAAPEDTEAALDDTPTYSISIHSLDASRNPVDSPLVWYSEVDAEGNTDKSKGPHAVFELSAADIANVTEAGEYWLAFHAYSGGERIVRAAGYLTFADDGFPTDPPTPTPPGTVYLTQAAGDARYVLDPGTVVDNRLVRWDGTSGNTVQSSLVTADDSGNIATPGSVSASSLQVAGTFQADMYVDGLSGDRTHDLPDADGTYAITGEADGKVKLIDLKDVTITTPSTGHVLTWNGTVWVNSAPSGGGGGGSVTITGQDGIGVSGSPGTSITLSLGNITPDALTVAGSTELRGSVVFYSIANPAFGVTLSAENLAEGGGNLYFPTASGTLATVSNETGEITVLEITDATTVGRNILKLTNPGAITFLRMNADNTVTALSDSSMRSALGLGNVATRNVGTTTGTAAAGDDSRFHAALTLDSALSLVFTLTDQALGPSATLSADGLVFWDETSGQFDVITLPGTTTVFLRGDGTFTATGDVAGPTSSTDNAIARFDTTTGKLIQTSALLVEDATTSTTNNVCLTVSHTGQTNSSLVVCPMGNGALIVGPKPDGTSTGGSARGTNAVDLQMTRTNVAHVASGASSFVGAGAGNAATASYSATVGGLANQATAAQACAHGSRAISNRLNMMAHGNAAANGECQAGRVIMRRTTTDATPVQLSMDGANPTGAGITTSTHFVLMNNQAVFADIRVVARSASGADHAAFMRRVLIKRDANIASTAIVDTVLSPTADLKSTGASTWAVSITAEASSVGGLLITVTGAAATTIVWGASVEFMEIIRA